MAIPNGVSTVTVNLVPPVGVPASELHVDAVPTIALKWSATNTPLVEMVDRPAGFGLILPASDQPGFVTATGDPFQGWGYIITLAGRIQGKSFSETYHLTLRSSQDTVDLGILEAPDGPTGSPSGGSNVRLDTDPDGTPVLVIG